MPAIEARQLAKTYYVSQRGEGLLLPGEGVIQTHPKSGRQGLRHGLAVNRDGEIAIGGCKHGQASVPSRRGRERLHGGGTDSLDERRCGGALDAGIFDGVARNHGHDGGAIGVRRNGQLKDEILWGHQSDR